VSPKLSLDQSIDEKVSPNNNDNNNNGDFSFALCCAFNLEKYFHHAKEGLSLLIFKRISPC
jgi:hypothetical protein